uniref:Putative secreted protein n=1 Tax=Ixodes ricinus TaxID=34613 RepID=A0A147BT49_IXORI
MRKKKKCPSPCLFFLASVLLVCFFPCLSQVVLFAHAAHAFATSLHQDRKVCSFRGLLASLSKVRRGGEGRMPSLCALCLGEGFSAFLSYLSSPCARCATLEQNCVVQKKDKKKKVLFFSFFFS